MFWSKRNPEPPARLASFPNYIVHKVVPHLDDRGEAAVLDTVRKQFRHGVGSGAGTTVLTYGREMAMLASLGFAAAISEVTGEETSDLEYGDCYLCALFCMAGPLRTAPEAAVQALTFWGGKFRADLDYLVFAEADAIDDLYVSGWDRFGLYHQHEDAIVPRAYLHLLAQMIRHRRSGHDDPYRNLDPMLGAERLVFASLEEAMDAKVATIINAWVKTAVKVQSIADEHDKEFWPDW
ncbi:hypothetical protein FKO01_04070 [Mesorhizobium sp. B2-3-3]|nr:hypothetical protein FKO01_04070 [Mesorhizobium sp. B2-3-3]